MVQDSTSEYSALGGQGGSLGFAGITPSAGVEVNLYFSPGLAFGVDGHTGGPCDPGPDGAIRGDFRPRLLVLLDHHPGTCLPSAI